MLPIPLPTQCVDLPDCKRIKLIMTARSPWRDAKILHQRVQIDTARDRRSVTD